MDIWACSDKGIVRTQNQDSYSFELNNKKTKGFAVVCDGMGGARAGNVASQMAADVFSDEVRTLLMPGSERKKADPVIEQAVSNANNQVFDKSKSPGGSFRGMGTTLVAAVCTGKKCTICNIGDSRAYFITDSGIQRVSRDHSVVEDMVARGDISEAQAKHHPQKNLITRAIGTEPEVHCDLYHLDVSPGNYLLLCSDGLSNLVEDQEILFEVLYGGSPETCCNRFIDIANERGGPDNITVVLISF